MKVAIYTQYMENYGAHEWDGKGECPQYWKAKGGFTYVIENLTPAQAKKAVESGFPTLSNLIERSDEGWREYITGTKVMDDDARVGEEWETVTKLAYVSGRWIATEVEENGEYGCMRREIKAKRASWVMLPNSKRGEYKCEYELHDGRIVASDKLGDAQGV